MAIGVGFDCSPMVFAADDRGIWYVKFFLNVIHLCESNFVLLYHLEGGGVLKVTVGHTMDWVRHNTPTPQKEKKSTQY
jgi:hypothetical protein